ncbi:MAG: hypothetical protein IPM48_11715 [Saprospiraceae bacterium]|nr:hypothetical protein [Saprospiraceae bacterium]
MIGKLKSLLGIEGPKIEIKNVNTSVPGLIQATLSISTFQKATIKEIDIYLKETYKSGRSKKHTKNEFILGLKKLDEPIELQQNSVCEINFGLEYTLIKSKIDKLKESNPWLSPLTGFAKTIRGVQSTFHLDLIAQVKGSPIPATDQFVIEKLK